MPGAGGEGRGVTDGTAVFFFVFGAVLTVAGFVILWLANRALDDAKRILDEAVQLSRDRVQRAVVAEALLAQALTALDRRQR